MNESPVKFEGYPKTFEELRRVLQAENDNRYVKQATCAERHEKTEKEISEIAINQARNTTQLENVTKLQWASLVAGIGAAASAIGNLIFK